MSQLSQMSNPLPCFGGKKRLLLHEEIYFALRLVYVHVCVFLSISHDIKRHDIQRLFSVSIANVTLFILKLQSSPSKEYYGVE